MIHYRTAIASIARAHTELSAQSSKQQQQQQNESHPENQPWAPRPGEKWDTQHCEEETNGSERMF